MSGYASLSPMIGIPPIANYGVADLTTEKIRIGTIINAVDSYWGGAELMYVQYPLSQAVKVGAIMCFDLATPFVASLVANTTLLGKSVGFALNAVASSATAQFGWIVIAGQSPVWCSASVAANTAFGIVAAGQGGALAAGKQINGARVTVAATTTVVKAGTNTLSGSANIQVPNADGWFVGTAISGTGIAAASVVSGIANDGRTITLNNAATATGSVSATGTYNDATNYWNIAVFDRPQAQGPIT